MKILKSALIYIVLPFALLLVGFNFSVWAGLLITLVLLMGILYKNIPNYYRIQALRKYKDDDLLEALKWMEKAHNTGKATFGSSISYAYLLLKSGEIEKSEKVFNALINSPRATADDKQIIKSNIALILWKKGEVEKGIEILENIIKDYKTTNIYGSLGYLYIEKGDLDRALEFNLEAREYNNTNSIILDNLGETYYRRGEIEEALNIYEELVKSNPQFPECYYHYALVLDALNKKEEALDMAKKASKFKTTFLSSVTKEQIKAKVEELDLYFENLAK